MAEVLLRMTVFICLIAIGVGFYTGWTAPSCPGSDCLNHSATFPACYSKIRSATYDCRWAANVNIRAPEEILNGRIIAYKIRWFNGHWSTWYVPGMNDIDLKFNLFPHACSIPYLPRSLRRMWAYFYDHTHGYIICE